MHKVNHLLYERLGDKVRSGPFAGLTLTPMTLSEQFGPFLLGVYERELFSAWRTVLNGSYDCIIDVGAKFGYYAIGLARRFPATPVMAYDIDPWARRAMREMRAANDAANVEIKSACTSSDLRSVASRPALIFSDCEGYEATLFTEDVITSLSHSVVFIETHDNFVPEVTASLKRRFATSHRLAVIESDAGMPDASLDFLTEQQRSLASVEVRAENRWILCLPNSGRNSGLKYLDNIPSPVIQRD